MAAVLSRAPPPLQTDPQNINTVKSLALCYSEPSISAHISQLQKSFKEANFNTLTQHELVQIHLLASVINSENTNADWKNIDIAIVDRLKLITSANAKIKLEEEYAILSETKFDGDLKIRAELRAHFESFLDMFVVLYGIHGLTNTYPKFVMKAKLKKLLNNGHIVLNTGVVSNDFPKALATLFNCVLKVCNFLTALEYLNSIDECIQVPDSFEITEIVDYQIHYLDIYTDAKPGNQHYESLAKAHEYIYNSMGTYMQNKSIEWVRYNPIFPLFILLTECLLSNVSYMSPEAKELQKREDIRDIGKQMYEEILAKDCNLSIRLPLEACYINFKLFGSPNEPVTILVKQFLEHLREYVKTWGPIYLPHSHQYFIYEFYTKVKQDSDISDGMNSIKDNADFISELKSHLKNSEKLNIFIQSMIESFYLNPADWKNAKKLYIALSVISGVLRAENIESIVGENRMISVGVWRDVFILHSGLQFVNFMNEVELASLAKSSEIEYLLSAVNQHFDADNNVSLQHCILVAHMCLQGVSQYQALYRALRQMQKNRIELPISLQVAANSLKSQLPKTEEASGLIALLNQYEENVAIKKEIDKWVLQNGEINSKIERILTTVMKYSPVLTKGGPLSPEDHKFVLDFRTFFFITSSMSNMPGIRTKLTLNTIVLSKGAIEALMGLRQQFPEYNEFIGFDSIDNYQQAINSNWNGIQNSISNNEAVKTAIVIQMSIAKHVNTILALMWRWQQNCVDKCTSTYQSISSKLVAVKDGLAAVIETVQRKRIYVLPSLACGIKSVQQTLGKTHKQLNLSIVAALQNNFATDCIEYEKLLSATSFRRTDKINPWIKLLEEPIEEAYSATNQELLEIAARKYWVRASSLHDANRLNLPRLTQIKTVVFLKSLALIFPNEISTHEWFSHETQTFTFGEEDEKMIPNIIAGFTELSKFRNLVETTQTEDRKHLCTTWLLLLLKAYNIKKINPSSFNDSLRRNGYPPMMRNIDIDLFKYCQDDRITAIRCKSIRYCEMVDANKADMYESIERKGIAAGLCKDPKSVPDIEEYPQIEEPSGYYWF